MRKQTKLVTVLLDLEKKTTRKDQEAKRTVLKKYVQTVIGAAVHFIPPR